jgi:hypothetical protein
VGGGNQLARRELSDFLFVGFFLLTSSCLSVCHSIISTFTRSSFIFYSLLDLLLSRLRLPTPTLLGLPSASNYHHLLPPKCTSNPSSPSCPSSSFPSYPYPSPQQASFPPLRSSTPHTSNPKSTLISNPTTARTSTLQPSVSLTIPPFTKRLTVRPHPVSAPLWPTKPPPGICAARSQSALRCRRGWIG